MGELRLYAIGIDEVRDLFGAPDEELPRLREIAHSALRTPATAGAKRVHRWGPIFRREPAALVLSPTEPVPQDVEMVLAGAYIPPDRAGACWRVLEVLTQGLAWGATRIELDPRLLDDVDFALARGGVPAALGLRHLIDSPAQLRLLAVAGLTVGYQSHAQALAMTEAYQEALPEVESETHQELLRVLISWLGDFGTWAHRAGELGRPAPDLVGFFAH